MKPLLKERIQERIGADGDALALAMRILVCKSMDIRDDVDYSALLHLQCDDGGWDICWVYQYGSSGIRVGNRGLTTALAINAIIAMREQLNQANLGDCALGQRSLVPLMFTSIPGFIESYAKRLFRGN